MTSSLFERDAVLQALAEGSEPDGAMCRPFKWLERETGLTRQRVRFLCRLLARQSLAEFHRGLWTEDGEPAGAGYCISSRGMEAFNARAASDTEGSAGRTSDTRPAS